MITSQSFLLSILANSCSSLVLVNRPTCRGDVDGKTIRDLPTARPPNPNAGVSNGLMKDNSGTINPTEIQYEHQESSIPNRFIVDQVSTNKCRVAAVHASKYDHTGNTACIIQLLACSLDELPKSCNHDRRSRPARRALAAHFDPPSA